MTIPLPSSTSAPASARPADRVLAVDALRGLALLGILVMHVLAFSAPGTPPGFATQGTPLDQTVALLGLLFVESKFLALFALLFGLSFALRRADARFPRRQLVLLALGVLHVVLLWEGDILIVYALLGLVLPRFRSWSPHRLARLAGALLLVPLLVYVGLFGVLTAARSMPDAAPVVASLDATLLGDLARAQGESVQVQQTGTYAELLERRVESYLSTAGLLLTRTPTVLAMFLLGLAAGRLGLVRQPDAHLGLLRRVRAWGLTAGLLAGLLVVVAQVELPPTSALVALTLNQALAGPLLALGYAAAFVLLVRRPEVRSRLGALAAVGRLALTNYLGQSLLLTLVFYGYGLGLAGRIGEAAALGLVVPIFTLQVVFSAWWTRSFGVGPLEWAWRTLSDRSST